MDEHFDIGGTVYYTWKPAGSSTGFYKRSMDDAVNGQKPEGAQLKSCACFFTIKKDESHGGKNGNEEKQV